MLRTVAVIPRVELEELARVMRAATAARERVQAKSYISVKLALFLARSARPAFLLCCLRKSLPRRGEWWWSLGSDLGLRQPPSWPIAGLSGARPRSDGLVLSSPEPCADAGSAAAAARASAASPRVHRRRTRAWRRPPKLSSSRRTLRADEVPNSRNRRFSRFFATRSTAPAPQARASGPRIRSQISR